MSYLLRVQKFEDQERLAILKAIDRSQGRASPVFDTAIDKRKYSHLKTWIEKRLSEIDVDKSLQWLLELEQAILTDQITTTQEKQLMQSLQRWRSSSFYFVKWYEVLTIFREDLLIRLRYEEVDVLDQFLLKNKESYAHSQEIDKLLQKITREIVEQYQGLQGETKKHITSLTIAFKDEKLDGYNRFKAFIRLIFIGFNYRDFDFLKPHFDYFDQMLTSGLSYSKRILLNYYSNRLLLHSRKGEYEEAERYGYLSIKVHTQDFLMYLNNLAAILLRNHKYDEAFATLQEGAKEAKETTNHHNKIGYVAFYVETLNRMGKFLNAENYASVFLSLYKKEIFKYRWHVFFTTYLESLLRQNKFSEIIRLAKKYKLQERAKSYSKKAGSLPIVSWSISIAEYEDGLIGEDQLRQTMQKQLSQTMPGISKEQLRQALAKISTLVPFKTDFLLKHYDNLPYHK